MRFRRKANSDIVAKQYLGSNGPLPPGVHPGVHQDPGGTAYIKLINGQYYYLTVGDWVAEESDGSGYYPIKDHVMKQNFEEIP